MESELDEARDEAAALRLQTKMLVEHIEGGHTGSTPSGFLDTQVDHQSNDESRHVAKLKKGYFGEERSVASLRSRHVHVATAGVSLLRGAASDGQVLL